MKSTYQMQLFNESQEWLEAARKAAIRIARENGQVSSDDVRKEVPITGAINHNVLGSLFKIKIFRWSGVKKSTTPKRKGGMIGVYTLREQT